MIAFLREHGYRWKWRLRHWWMDTPSGFATKVFVVTFCLAFGLGVAVARILAGWHA